MIYAESSGIKLEYCEDTDLVSGFVDINITLGRISRKQWDHIVGALAILSCISDFEEELELCAGDV
jgi:hypothetical protein